MWALEGALLVRAGKWSDGLVNILKIFKVRMLRTTVLIIGSDWVILGSYKYILVTGLR